MVHCIKDFAPGDIDSGESVAIFGTGDIAQLTHYALTSLGVEVAFFCDPVCTGDADSLLGVEVISPTDLERLDAASTCVFDAWDHTRYARQAEFLERFSRVFVSVGLLQRTDFSGVGVPLASHARERLIAYYADQCNLVAEGEGSLRLSSLDVVVTEACTMRCVDCSNLMQYYAHPRHSDLQELHLALDRLMASVDGVDEFRVLGGEPFANPRVGQVLEKLTHVESAQRVVVFTNGTLIPKAETLATLTHPKVLVRITDYGDLSKRHDELCERLTQENIAWATQKPTWTDSGRIDEIERTQEELDRTFRDCCVNDLMTLLNGRLYLCPFSANALNLGAVPDAPDDLIDLRVERPAADLRARIAALYGRNKPLSACSFCRGRDQTTPIIEPAIQVRRPLPLTVLSGRG